MYFEQSATSQTPITIDEGFLGSIARFFTERRGAFVHAVEDHSGLPRGKLHDLSLGQIPDDSESEDMPDWKVKHYTDLLQRHAAPSIDLKYKTTRTIKVNDFDELGSALRDEIDSPISLTVSAGIYGINRVQLSFDNDWQSEAKISAQGERDFVERALVDFDRILKRHETPWRWVHTKPASWLVFVVVLLAVFLAIVLTAARVNYLNTHGGAPLWGIIFPAAIFVALTSAEYMRNRFRSAFSNVRFSYGLDERRRQEKSALLWGFVTLIVLPVLINLMV